MFGLSLAFASAAPAPITPSVGAAVPADTGHLDAGGGIRLYYYVLGGAHRDTIVLVHGGPGLISSYLQRDLDFVAVRHTVLLYDQRGSGRSTLVDDSTKISMALHVADLDAVLNHFRISHANLYGHSWGAGLVANYITVHPSTVRRTILGSAIPPRRSPYMAQFGTQLNAWADGATKARLNERARASGCGRSGRGMSRVLGSVHSRLFRRHVDDQDHAQRYLRRSASLTLESRQRLDAWPRRLVGLAHVARAHQGADHGGPWIGRSDPDGCGEGVGRVNSERKTHRASGRWSLSDGGAAEGIARRDGNGLF